MTWRIQLLAAVAVLTLSLRPAQAVTIATVPIGDLGNNGDAQPQGTFGAVAYYYRMGVHEVTNSQYVAFLNAVAATDTYQLYAEEMTSYTQGGILRSGTPGGYAYSIKPPAEGAGPGGSDYDYSDKPVVNVSYYDAARFANWLHNGQPVGLQDASTTEGGAYTLTGPATISARNPGAVWFLPTENEWYKAAYYDPEKNGVGGYFDYPTGTDLTPNNSLPVADNGNSANFDGTWFYPMTDVGAYTLSASPFGTFDQGGNVSEWTEAIVIDPFVGPSRVWRGGDYGNPVLALHASTRSTTHPSNTGRNLGFRVANIPEPSTAALAALGVTILAAWARRRSRSLRQH